jgi:HSP20 family molecular chaperone IbpA
MSEIRTNRDGEQLSNVPRVTPTVDIFENDQEVRLYADLPGVHADALELHLDGHTLSIRAPRPASDEAGRRVAGRPRPAIEYRRSFRLPRTLDTGRISADLSAGVLTVTLPKADEVRPRAIPVNAG